MLSADSALPPEEAAKSEVGGQLGASIVAGDVNDVVTIATGYDYITNEPVPHFSEEWYYTVGMALLPVVSGATLRAVNKVTNVAFAMNDYLPALKRLAPNSLNYRDLGLDPYADDFADQLLNVMHNSEHIDFSISGMRQLSGADGVLTGPVELNIPGSTNWELRTIWDNPQLKSKTTFYRDGKVVLPEEILSLD